jgi:IS30 family transposase
MLKDDLRRTIETLVKRGASMREISRATGVSRNTISSHIRRAAPDARSTVATEEVAAETPPCPPAPAAMRPTNSVCEPYREWIASQLRLRRNAQSIYQDLVEIHCIPHRYSAVERFVRKLKTRDPKQFDVLEFMPAEEAQVDYGQGALTLNPSGNIEGPTCLS